MGNFTVLLLHDFIMRQMRCVAHTGELRTVFKILDGKPEGKRPVRIPSHKWEGNMKMHIKEIGCGSDWLNLA
jgi:hypothetical protein